MTNLPLECSKDDLYQCESVLGRFLCTLSGEQEFDLEDIQFAGQDKILSYQDLLSQTLIL